MGGSQRVNYRWNSAARHGSPTAASRKRERHDSILLPEDFHVVDRLTDGLLQNDRCQMLSNTHSVAGPIPNWSASSSTSRASFTPMLGKGTPRSTSPKRRSFWLRLGWKCRRTFRFGRLSEFCLGEIIHFKEYSQSE